MGRWVLAATILASSMAFIDGTVVNVALPFLQTDLNATAIGIQWVVEAYSLFLSALLLVGGSLGDRYGRRRIFNIGVVIFAVASALCGFAANIEQLIVARAVQGIGGALLVPGSLALISSSFDEDKRGKAIGTWSGFSAITTAIGPVLGGWLVENISWRAAFFLNLPLALAVLLISLWKVPESRDKNHQWSPRLVRRCARDGRSRRRGLRTHRIAATRLLKLDGVVVTDRRCDLAGALCLQRSTRKESDGAFAICSAIETSPAQIC